ncbi:MAG TPA: hypothetical protein VGR08_02720 [Thermomicrobiales bacterium]|nr:hypothetical protein [Thermomicrobiales bacterium]
MNRTFVTVWGLVAALLLSVVSGAAVAGAQGATPEPAEPGGNDVAGLRGAAEWLVSQQGDDGAFLGFTGESDPGVTIDAVIALASAERAGVDTGTSIDDAVQYLASGDVALVYAQSGVGQAAKLSLGLAAAGEDPADFASVQPLTLVENGQDDETGIYGTGIYDHGLAMLALVAGGLEVPQSAIDALAETQAPNGGWGFDGVPDDAAVDSNTTALVIQALVASGNADSDLVASGMDYLATTVTGEGVAFDAQPGSVADSNSTALAAQAYLAAGEDASALLQALAGFQNPNGAFFYNPEDTSDNLFSTVQAVPALAGTPLPITATPEAGDATPVGLIHLRAA